MLHLQPDGVATDIITIVIMSLSFFSNQIIFYSPYTFYSFLKNPLGIQVDRSYIAKLPDDVIPIVAVILIQKSQSKTKLSSAVKILTFEIL